MKYMLLIYADENAWTPEEREKCYAESIALTHDLKARGQYVTASPLQSVTTATSLRIREGKRLVTDGPFAETKELVAGFWLWKCASLAEAIDWAKRCPAPMGPGQESELEIRQVFENEDFGAEFTPELRAQEDRLRAELAAKTV